MNYQGLCNSLILEKFYCILRGKKQCQTNIQEKLNFLKLNNLFRFIYLLFTFYKIKEKIPEITFQDKPEVLSLGAPVKSEL